MPGVVPAQKLQPRLGHPISCAPRYHDATPLEAGGRRTTIRTRAEKRLLEDVLVRAGREALSVFHDVRAETKADGTAVTVADRAAQDVIVEALVRAFPGTGVIGEEGIHIEGGGGTWYVDPIDGTSAFLEGLPAWGPTVCLVQGGDLVLGAWFSPLTGEFWYAARGDGAWRGDVRLRAVPRTELTSRDAILVPSRFHRLPPVRWPGKVRALGATAAHLAYVAGDGPVAAFVARWRLWDVGCGALLVTEAGRQLVDLDGARYHPVTDGGPPFLAGDPLAIERLVAVLPRAPRSA